jgi:predicted transglutaminase-like protease
MKFLYAILFFVSLMCASSCHNAHDEKQISDNQIVESCDSISVLPSLDSLRCVEGKVRNGQFFSTLMIGLGLNAQEAYDLTIDDLLGKKQSQNIANPRHIAIFLIRDMLSLSLNDIGRIFGRNHTTIMSSEAKINNLMKESPDFSEKLEQLKNDIKSK